MTELQYQTSGTCSQLIYLRGEHGRIDDVRFVGGCNGNLQGISALVRGQKYDDVIRHLEGIRCGYKRTSCPDQLAQALKLLKAKEAEQSEQRQSAR